MDTHIKDIDFRTMTPERALVVQTILLGERREAQMILENNHEMLRLLARHLPPVPIRELSPHGAGIRDSAFRHATHEFMERYMRGFDPTEPAVEGWTDVDEWEFIKDGPWKVMAVDLKVVMDVEGTHSWMVTGTDDPHYEADSDADNIIGMLSADPADYHEDYEDTVYVAVNTDEHEIGDDVWDDEGSAEDDCARRNAGCDDDGYGFPWAWNWSWEPDSIVSDDVLLAAGFRVGTFQGTRYCGIDGGGYDFESAHFGPLYARFCIEYREGLVETESGPREVEV